MQLKHMLYIKYLSHLIWIFLVILFLLSSEINSFVFVILIFLSAVFIYARFIEPNLIRIKKYKINFKKNKTKIVVISDLHLGVYKGSIFLQRVVKKINKINPDIVLIAGDLTFEIKRKDLYAKFSSLKKIKAPVYTVLGNHDFHNKLNITDDLKKVLNNFKITLIDNKIKKIKVKNNLITLIGLECFSNGSIDYSLLKEVGDNDISIVLTHNPDLVCDFPRNNKIDLVISGHTHGGQIRIPFLYKKVMKKTIAMRYSFNTGFYNINNTKVFVSSGLGEVILPMRFLIPPEISVLEI